MSNLPMNLLIIGHEASRLIASLVSRSDIQLHDAEILWNPSSAPPAQAAWYKFSRLSGDQIDGIIENGKALVSASQFRPAAG
jgi:hypothetical protein